MPSDGRNDDKYFNALFEHNRKTPKKRIIFKKIITKSCLLVESSFLLSFIWSSPSLVMREMILVFSRLLSRSFFFLARRDYLAFSMRFMASRSSCLNFSRISSTYFVGSSASKTFRSMWSPNFNMCFSSYFLFRSSNFAVFSLICFSSTFLRFISCLRCLSIFFCSISSSFMRLCSRWNSEFVKRIESFRSSGSLYWVSLCLFIRMGKIG